MKIAYVNVFVTDLLPPEPVVELCRQTGVKIEIAGNAAEEEQEKVA